jgi:hypothetical protein
MNDGLNIDNNGTKYWYINGKRHRTDGPAIEDSNGYTAWYINDELHRTDGPAIEHSDGTKYWYINGEYLSEEQYLRTTRNKKLEILGL